MHTVITIRHYYQLTSTTLKATRGWAILAHPPK